MAGEQFPVTFFFDISRSTWQDPHLLSQFVSFGGYGTSLPVAPVATPFPVPQPMPAPTTQTGGEILDDLLDRPVTPPDIRADEAAEEALEELLDRPVGSGSDFEELMKRPYVPGAPTQFPGQGVIPQAVRKRLQREALKRAAMKFGVRALGPLGGVIDIFTPGELGSGELPGGPGSANEPGDRLEDIIVDAVRLPKPKPRPKLQRMPAWPPEPPLIPAKPSKGVPESAPKSQTAAESQTGLLDLIPSVFRVPTVKRLARIVQVPRSLGGPLPIPGLSTIPLPSPLPSPRSPATRRSPVPFSLPFPNPFGASSRTTSSRSTTPESCQQCAADRCMQRAAEQARKKPTKRNAGRKRPKKQKLCLDLNSILKLIGSK